MVRNYSTAQRFLALVAHKKRVKKSVCPPEFFSKKKLAQKKLISAYEAVFCSTLCFTLNGVLDL